MARTEPIAERARPEDSGRADSRPPAPSDAPPDAGPTPALAATRAGSPDVHPEVLDLTDDRPRDERSAEHAATVGRGRRADRPTDIPAAGWKDVALRVKGELKRDQVSLLSAGVAFYLLLALFPAMAAGVSVYALLADPADVARQVADLAGTLPDNARSLVTDQLQDLAAGGGGSAGATVGLGVLAALWSASSGIKHLISAINAAYDEDETRGFIGLRALAVFLTLAAIGFGVVAVAVLAFLPVTLTQTGLGGSAQAAVRALSYPLLAVGFGLGLAVLYRYGPDRDHPKWRWVSPGAVLATVVWIVASLGFSFYAANFGSYADTYGSIGAVIVLLLWLAITAFSIILGAELDSEIEAQTARDSTVGSPEPMGDRDAEKADELGEAVAADPSANDDGS